MLGPIGQATEMFRQPASEAMLRGIGTPQNGAQEAYILESASPPREFLKKTPPNPIASFAAWVKKL